MRKFSLALVAFGAFLVVLAPMARWYAYPRLATAPPIVDELTTLVAKDATVLDIATLKPIQTDLRITAHTVGDAAAVADRPGKVVYVNAISTTSSDGQVRSRETQRIAFDARTGQASSCCSTFISDIEGVEENGNYSGLVAKFPFETERRTYSFWDSSLRGARPIDYVRDASIGGVKVLEFHQGIPASTIGTLEVPRSLLGMQGDGNVVADKVYQGDRTLWVEPETGAIVQRREASRQVLKSGENQVVLSDVTAGYDDKTLASNISEFGRGATFLHALRATGPAWSAGAGAVALVLGAVLSRRRRSVDAPVAARPDREAVLVAG